MSAAAIASLALLTAPARADDGDRTVQAQFSPSFVGGKLQGCNLTFNVAHRDRATLNGGMTLLVGTVAVAKANEKAGLVMRLTVARPSVDGKPSVQVAPAEAGLQDGRKTNASSLAGTRDLPASTRAFVFRADQQTAAMLSSMVSSSRITAYYALKAGELASNFDVDLTVAKIGPKGEVIRDPGTPGRFTTCLRDLGGAPAAPAAPDRRAPVT